MDESLTLLNPKVGEVYYSPTHGAEPVIITYIDENNIYYDFVLENWNGSFLKTAEAILTNYYIVRGKRKRKMLRDVLRGKYGN